MTEPTEAEKREHMRGIVMQTARYAAGVGTIMERIAADLQLGGMVDDLAIMRENLLRMVADAEVGKYRGRVNREVREVHGRLVERNDAPAYVAPPKPTGPCTSYRRPAQVGRAPSSAPLPCERCGQPAEGHTVTEAPRPTARPDQKWDEGPMPDLRAMMAQTKK